MVATNVNDLDLPYLDLLNAQTRAERRQLLDAVRRSDHWLCGRRAGT